LPADPLEFLLQPRPAEPGVAGQNVDKTFLTGVDTYALEEQHMHNETQVNTTIGDLPSVEAKKVDIPSEYVGRVITPFGHQYIERGCALDHARMCSGQLSSLLLLIGGEGLGNFISINAEAQEHILWLARQLATETKAMFDIVVADQQGGAA